MCFNHLSTYLVQFEVMQNKTFQLWNITIQTVICYMDRERSILTWNFRQWVLLWPENTTAWPRHGLDMGLAVPSINPQQLSSGAPLSWITAENLTGSSHAMSKFVRRWPYSLWICSAICIREYTHKKNSSVNLWSHFDKKMQKFYLFLAHIWYMYIYQCEVIWLV